MSDVFQIRDAVDAQDLLSLFPQPTRKHGEKIYGQGGVRELRSIEPGVEYAAIVDEGRERLEVMLTYDEVAGWEGSCDCPEEVDCAHIYAATKALLAENSIAAVRNISTGAVTAPKTSSQLGGADAASGKKNGTGKLADIASSALGRALTRDEAYFCKKLANVHTRGKVYGRLTYWDLGELDLNLGTFMWSTPLEMPGYPESELELWLYIANTVIEGGGKIPKFLEPITDLTEIRERVAQIKRQREIEEWKSKLLLMASQDESENADEVQEVDLQVMFTEDSALVQWKHDGKPFSTLKVKQLGDLMLGLQEGRIGMAPEAQVLCALAYSAFHYSGTADLDYEDEQHRPTLSRILRVPGLESRTVDRLGKPLSRPSEPLRWRVVPAETDDGVYRFKLVKHDGADCPLILFHSAGKPSFYVTPEGIYRGPLPRPNLKPEGENVIPAAAIETRPGLQFLSALGIEMPQRIRDRVQQVSLQVVVECELEHTYPGSSIENCFFKIFAQSPDGKYVETWMGDGWESHETNTGRRRADDDTLVVYDRALAQKVGGLTELLSLKRDGFGQRMFMRVSKKFPDVFVPWLKSLPPQVEVKLSGELASLAQEAISGTVRLDVQEAAIDWFDLSVVLDVSDTTLSQDEIKLLLNARGGYVRLGDKGWRRLQFNLTAEEDERLANLGLNPHELTAEPQRLHALQLADAAARKFLPEHQAEQIHRRATEIKARVTPPLPSGVTAELRPYQLEGFHFLAYLQANHFGGILADDMGLGKTLQTLAWILWLREQPGANRAATSLVVCPKSVMDNWQAEAERFTPGLRVKRWSSSELENFQDHLRDADLHVINYSQLRMLGESLVPVQWLAVILDEGQYIKNPNSQTTQIARVLRAEHRLVLSGTPIENRLLDLWSLMSFAMPGVLSSRAQFGKLYDGKGDPLARKRLAARVRPFLLRRTKAQVAKDLPDRVEEDLFCELEGEQKTLYRAELKRAQQILLKVQTQKQLNEERFNFLTSLLRLRQICCHPALVKPDIAEGGAKLEALFDQIEPLMEEGHKVLVFSQFVELLSLLKTEVEKREWPLFYLTGETEDRGDLVRRFQAKQGEAIFLISLKAGGFGLNLTAASYVVLFDPWWNPAVENQAIDRTHRIGQVNKVIAYRLLIKDSVEEKIRKLQKQKSALAQDVLGEEKFAQGMTLDDLQFLLAD